MPHFEIASSDPTVEPVWLENESGAMLNIQGWDGGPGWAGVRFTIRHGESSIYSVASWPTALGNYQVAVSMVILPVAMRTHRESIEGLLTNGITALCQWSSERDFSPRPFCCVVDLTQTKWVDK